MTRRHALLVTQRWLADREYRRHRRLHDRITDGDRADAQELERLLLAAGWVWVEAPEFDRLGPGAGLTIVKETGT